MRPPLWLLASYTHICLLEVDEEMAHVIVARCESLSSTAFGAGTVGWADPRSDYSSSGSKSHGRSSRSLRKAMPSAYVPRGRHYSNSNTMRLTKKRPSSRLNWRAQQPSLPRHRPRSGAHRTAGGTQGRVPSPSASFAANQHLSSLQFFFNNVLLHHSHHLPLACPRPAVRLQDWQGRLCRHA